MKAANLSFSGWVCGLLLLLSAAGCATARTVTEAEGEGERRTFAAEGQQVWSAMQAAVETTGGRVKESDEEHCRLVAGYPASAWSWGEWVALFCRPVADVTEIEIVMQPNLRTNVFPKDRVAPLFAAIEEALATP